MAPTPTAKQTNRLVRRLSLMFASVVAVASLVLGAIGVYFEWQAVNEGFNQKLTAIATMAALQIDGDAFSLIREPGDSEKPEYKAISAQLNAVLKDQGLAYAYTLVRTDAGIPVLRADGSEEPEPVGTEYEPAPALDQLYETGSPAVGGITNEADYGRLKTAYAPIRNSKGELVGAVAVDLAAEVIYEKMTRAAIYYALIWLLVMIAAVGLSVRVARTIARRVTPLSAAAYALASGDLRVTMGKGMSRKKPDEVDELHSSLQQMQGSLGMLVRNLRSSAEQVVGATQELVTAVGRVGDLTRQADEAMNQVAAGTSQQAANAGEVASFFAQFSEGMSVITEAASSQAALVTQAAQEAAEIARVTEQVVQAATAAAAVAAETTQAARVGSTAVDETAGAVQRIAGAVTEASEGMERLSVQARHIGEISSTIRDLAEQSNLLALNAAIEAARAGEHGRGFAVVADEVRKLAGRSAQSADQITEILNAIRTDIDATLGQMRFGSSTLEAGSEKAHRAKEALAVIERSAQRTREQIEQVASESSRTARRAREIGEKAQQAARQVRESTEGARQVAASSGRAEDAVQSVAAISEETASLAGNTQSLMTEVARTTVAVKGAVESLVGVSEELKKATARFQV